MKSKKRNSTHMRGIKDNLKVLLIQKFSMLFLTFRILVFKINSVDNSVRVSGMEKYLEILKKSWEI